MMTDGRARLHGATATCSFWRQKVGNGTADLARARRMVKNMSPLTGRLTSWRGGLQEASTTNTRSGIRPPQAPPSFK